MHREPAGGWRTWGRRIGRRPPHGRRFSKGDEGAPLDSADRGESGAAAEMRKLKTVCPCAAAVTRFLQFLDLTTSSTVSGVCLA